MAYTKKNLGNLKQSLADRHDSGVLPTDSATLTFWTRLLNRGQAYCSDKLRMIKSTDLTTSSGVIALPDDFITIDKVFKDTTEYSQISETDVLYQDTANTFWITGNHTDGFFLNSPLDETLTVKYAFRPAEMVSDSDVCVIPDPEAVVAYAYAMLRRSETDPIGDATTALQECDARLNEVQDAKNINDNFLGFTIQ